jgi:nucleoside-diphosphate-sugar epimerase
VRRWKEKEMRVFVAGGSGAIGQHLVPKLVAAGHQVAASARSADKLVAIQAQGAEGVIMDGLDRASVMAAVEAARPDVIVHQMTALAKVTGVRNFDREFALTNRLRTEGTHYLVEAAMGNGVGRVVVQSFTGWTNERSGSPVKDETAPLDPHPPKTMRESLDAIADLEKTVTTATGVEGLVLRYGQLYGPGSPAFLDVVRQRKLPVVGNGAALWSFVQVADAADATMAAVERGPAGLYNIVDDDPAPATEWIPYLARVAGAKPPLHVPVWVGKLAAGEAVVSLMTQARGSANGKAKALLGWAPRYASWRDGFVAWVAEDETSDHKAAARPEGRS